VAERRSLPVRARRLASELRRLREEAIPTGAEAADRLGWKPSKLSRIETGQTAIAAGDLEQMLNLYQVSGARRDWLTELNRATQTRGWWDAYTGTISDAFADLIELEDGGESECHYAPIIIPGILQTERYTEEVTRATVIMTPPSEIARIATARMIRQKVLTRAEPLNLVAILDEAALRREVGGPDIMREQLLHLAEMADLPNVKIHVLPFSRGPHLGMSGVFTLLKFPEITTSGVVYLQSITGDQLIESDDEVLRYGVAFDSLLELALNSEQSKEFITGLTADY
jgi:transcriptional regulator with XRE-family HTH domain